MGPRVSDTIIKDHRELEDYFNKIVSSTDPTEQTAFQNQFTWELARHSVGEELIVYPAFEKHLKDGAKMADKDRREHQSVSVPFPSVYIGVVLESELIHKQTGKRATENFPKHDSRRREFPANTQEPDAGSETAHEGRRK